MRGMVNRAVPFTLIVVAALVALVQLDPVPVRSQKTVAEQPARHASVEIPETNKQQVVVAYGKLPLSFEPNQGQTDSRVKFLSRGSGHTLFLTSTEAVLALRPRRAKPSGGDHGAATRPEPPAQRDVLRIRLVGANPAPQMTGLDALPGKSNYFIGKDPQKWRKNVPHYTKVRYESVYPDIDLVFYGNQRRLEYDFVVAPGADPGAIALGFEGVDRLEIDPQGDLVVHMAGGEVRFQKPFVYQELDGARQIVPGHYTLKSDDRIGFQIAAYDAGKALIIDPVLAYSTYLGGEYGEYGRGIAVDGNGYAYVAGSTRSLDFPVNGAFQYWCAPSETWEYCETTYAFVTKLELNAAGTDRGYSTYLGGSGYDYALDIAVDGAGNAYVTGSTASTDFPTKGALQPKCTPTVSYTPCEDAFVAQLSADGDLAYSTYLGGNGYEAGVSVGLKPGCTPVCLIYVVGSTSSADFATTEAFQTTLGGKSDAFLVLIDPMGGTEFGLVYSTYFGGSYSESGRGVAVDPLGHAYMVGRTFSEDLPTTTGAFDTNCGDDDLYDCIPSSSIIPFYDAFVAKLDPADGNGDPSDDLVYATYLGGTDRDAWHSGDVAVDVDGFLYVTGDTASPDFPTTVGAFQPTHNGAYNAFVTKLNPDPTGPTPDPNDLIYSTYLGGSEGTEEAYGIAVQPGCPKEPAKGCIAYVTGQTSSPDFPTTEGAFQSTIGWVGDPFVIKLNPSGSELLYSTYLGGSTFRQNYDGSQSSPGEYGLAIALDAAGHAYVTGVTGSDDFPVIEGAFDTDCGDNLDPGDCAGGLLTDAFIAKFEDGPGIHIGGMELVERSSGKRMWRATVGVELHGSDETPGGEDDVIMGEWRGSAGYQLAASCPTDAMGACKVSSGDIPNKNDPVVFTVTDVTPASSLTYDASANHDPDPDSNGTQITVFKSEKGSGDGGGGGKPCNPNKPGCNR